MHCDWKKKTFIEKPPRHARGFCQHVTTPRLPRVSFALAMVLTMNARRFQTTSFEWNGILVWDLLSLRLLLGQNECGSACSCVFEAGSDREERSSDVRYVGENTIVFLWTDKWMTTPCTLIIFVMQQERLILLTSCHIATKNVLRFFHS